jgi:antitoxin component YwqK of YwqJK toxin-antitoxin module
MRRTRIWLDQESCASVCELTCRLLTIMQTISILVLALVTGSLAAQPAHHAFAKIDSLNNHHYSQLRNTGDYNRDGSKTGYWIEYRLLFEHPGNMILKRFKGLDSLAHETKVTTLEKSEGEYASGVRINQWNAFEATYDETDSLVWEMTSYGQFADGRKHGPEKAFRLGALIREAAFEHGELHGTELLHSVNGALHLKAQWNRGKPVSAVMYDMNGKIISMRDYTLYPLAKVVEYHRNGRVRCEYTVLGDNEVLHGEYAVYDESGKLTEKKRYRGGVEDKE